MLILPQYNLHSVTIGCRIVRTFAVDDTRGVIADYILGECGAEDTPLPANYYSSIRMGDNGIQLSSKDNVNNIVVNRDSIAITARSANQSTAIATDKTIFNIAKHIIPGILHLLEDPNLILVGFVYEFLHKSIKPSERFSHPASEHIAKRVLKLNPSPNDYISNVNIQTSIRHRLPEAVTNHDINDYLAVHLAWRDVRPSQIWPETNNFHETPTNEESRIALLSVDMQRIFIPRRSYATKLLEDQAALINRDIEPRINKILEELKFGSDSQET